MKVDWEICMYFLHVPIIMWGFAAQNLSGFRPERCWRVWSPAILSTALVGEPYFGSYCWWLKSQTTTQDVQNSVKNGIFAIWTGAPSTVCLITFGTHFRNIMIHDGYYNASYIVEGWRDETCFQLISYELNEQKWNIWYIYITTLYIHSTLQFAYCLPCPCVAPGTIWWFSHGIKSKC